MHAALTNDTPYQSVKESRVVILPAAERVYGVIGVGSVEGLIVLMDGVCDVAEVVLIGLVL